MILIPVKLAGRYKLSARRPDGRIRPLTSWFSNIILDQGLDLVAASRNWLDCCQVGDDDTPEANGQTALINRTAGTSTRVDGNSFASAVSPFKGTSAIVYEFAVGAVVGAVREVGVGTAVSGATLFSRSRARDAKGAVTEVEVLADEALQVSYQLTVSVPETDITGTITDTLSGAEYDYTLRAALAGTALHWAPYDGANFATAGRAAQAVFTTAGGAHVQAFDGAIGAITSSPGGAAFNCTDVINDGYVAGSHVRTAQARFGVNAANGSNIRSLLFRFAPGAGSGGNSFGAYQVEIDPVRPKDSDHELLFNIGIAWSRA